MRYCSCHEKSGGCSFLCYDERKNKNGSLTDTMPETGEQLSGGKTMRTITFFDTKPYDKVYFDQKKESYGFEITYLEEKLNRHTARLAEGTQAVVAFVNDTLDQETIEQLYEVGVRVIGMRCAGYNNVDFEAAYGKIHIVRVPAYSPYAVAEYAMGVLLMLNRKLHRAYNRTREFNFSLNGLDRKSVV